MLHLDLEMTLFMTIGITWKAVYNTHKMSRLDGFSVSVTIPRIGKKETRKNLNILYFSK